MYEPSETLHELAQQLFELSCNDSFFGRSTRKQDAALLLRRIVKLDTLDALPSIAAHLFSWSDDVRAIACQAIDRLLSLADPLDFLHLTEVMGHSWKWPIHPLWDTLQPGQVGKLIADGSTRATVCGLASFHRNGFVRHEAVKQLSLINDGRELPFLLIRQNDWVDPISIDAQAAVLSRLDQRQIVDFMRCLPLAIHLLAFSRRDHSFVVRRVIGMLIQDENEARLAEVIQLSPRIVRRELVRMSLLVDGEHRQRVVMQGLASYDAIVRLRCTMSLRQCFSGDALLRILRRVELDKSVPVRRAALIQLAEAFPVDFRQIWSDALLDSSASIRELARFKMSKECGFSATAYYRDAVARMPESLAAFAGLAETGDETDLPTIRAGLKHAKPCWRRVAVQGLALVGKGEVADELLECLCDDSTSVMAVARRQLAKIERSPNNARLFQLVSHDQRAHVRDAALWLIFTSGKWDSLPWLIRAAIHADSPTAQAAQDYLKRWFSDPLINKVFTKPSVVNRQALELAWTESQSQMDAGFRAKLQGWLTTF